MAPQLPSLFVHYIPVGTSEPQDFGLRHNAGQPIIGTGIDVELELYEKNAEGVWVPVDEYTRPIAAWLDEAAGSVRVTGVESLAVGNYRVRFRFRDAQGQEGYHPNGEKADLWKVVAIAN